MGCYKLDKGPLGVVGVRMASTEARPQNHNIIDSGGKPLCTYIARLLMDGCLWRGGKGTYAGR
jgi:hypothetical protein